MGMMQIEVEGHSVRYYDNGSAVFVDELLIGSLVPMEDKLDLFRVDTDEERRRSRNKLEGAMRAMALSHLQAQT